MKQDGRWHISYKYNLMIRQNQNQVIAKLKRYFINRNPLSLELQMVLTLLQFILFVLVLKNYDFFPDNLGEEQDYKLTLLIQIILCFLTRAFLQLSIVSIFYISVSEAIISNSIDSFSVMILISLLILIGMDIISNIAFDFSSNSFKSQQLNWIKPLHYIVMIFGIVVNIKYPNSILHLSIAVSSFTCLLIAKTFSQAKSKSLKHLILRLYSWVILQYLNTLIFQNHTNHFHPILYLLPLLFSQLLFQIIKCCYQQPTLTQIHIAKKYMQLSYRVCNYLMSQEYDQQLQKEMNQLFGIDCEIGLQERDKFIGSRLMQLLDGWEQIQGKLLRVQIIIYCTRNLLKGYLLLQKIRKNAKWYNFIDRILIYRLQQLILSAYKQQNNKVTFNYYQQCIQAEQFSNLILKASIKFIRFYQYLKKRQITTPKLRKMANQLVQLERTLFTNYNLMKYKCMTIIILYASFLLQIIRDKDKAKQLIDIIQFQHSELIYLNINQKIFVKFSLNDQSLRFQYISNNVSNLLGFTRKQLEVQTHQIFLPQFYRKSHTVLVKMGLQNNFIDMFLFRKKTLIRNNWGYYTECDILLKLCYEMDDYFSFVGFLHIKNNPKYNLRSYLLIDSSKAILECSANFAQFQPSFQLFHSANEVFQNCLSINYPQFKSSFGEDQIECEQDEYHPIVQFIADNRTVYFFAAVNKSNRYMLYQQFLTISQQNKLKSTDLLKSISLQQHQDKQLVYYFSKMNKTILNLFHWEYICQLTTATILLLGLLISQFYLIQATNIKTNHQDYVNTAAQYFLSYYNSTFKLGLDMNCIDLRFQYNYHSIHSRFDFINSALQLQRANQYLKVFNGPTYSLDSLVEGYSYSKTNYELILELLSTSYLIEQFKNDGFQVKQTLARSRLLSQDVFIFSMFDYRINFFKKITGYAQIDKIYNIVPLSVIFGLSFLFQLVVARIQYKLRCNQKESLALIISLPPTSSQIIIMKKFVRKITKQYISYDFGGSEQTQHFEAVKLKAKNTMKETNLSQITKTQMSLRQTGRNLVKDINLSEVIETIENKEINQLQRSHVVALGKTNKIIFFTSLLVLFLLTGLTLTNHLLNNIILDVDQVQSATSFIQLYRTSAYFSRSVVNLLNLINQKSTNQTFNTTIYDKYMTDYRRYLSSVIIPIFGQAQLQEFVPFKQALNQLQYHSMCSFMSCSKEYYIQIDLLYTITIQKLVNSYSQIQSDVRDNNISVLSSKLQNEGLKGQLNMIIYTQQVIRGWIIRTSQIYVKCYQQYAVNLRKKKMGFIYAIFGVTSVGVALFVMFALYLCINLSQLQQIIQLIKIGKDWERRSGHPQEEQIKLINKM